MFLSYWKELLVITLSGLIIWYVMNLRLDLAEANNSLLLLTNQLEENQMEYDNSIAAYKIQDKEIEVKWRTKYETIYIWGDNNASCEDVMDRFNSTVY